MTRLADPYQINGDKYHYKSAAPASSPLLPRHVLRYTLISGKWRCFYEALITAEGEREMTGHGGDRFGLGMATYLSSPLLGGQV